MTTEKLNKQTKKQNSTNSNREVRLQGKLLPPKGERQTEYRQSKLTGAETPAHKLLQEPVPGQESLNYS